MARHHHRRAWVRARRAALERAGWRCEECGRPGRLDVHHRVAAADGGGDDLANLRALCVGCHLDQHAGDADRRLWRAMLARVARRGPAGR